MVTTQLWFLYRYQALYQHFAALPSVLVILRDLGLVALFVLLVWSRRIEAATRGGDTTTKRVAGIEPA
jgi:hypothetical protein